jgi:hypothetical protein
MATAMGDCRGGHWTKLLDTCIDLNATFRLNLEHILKSISSTDTISQQTWVHAQDQQEQLLLGTCHAHIEVLMESINDSSIYKHTLGHKLHTK